GAAERRRALARRPRDRPSGARGHTQRAAPSPLRAGRGRRAPARREAARLGRRPTRRALDVGRLAAVSGRVSATGAASMSFQWPLALVGLVVVPVLVAVYIRRERRRADFAARFTTPALLPNLVAAAPKWRRHLPLAVLLLALTAMVVGVARPHATLTV